LVGIREYSKLVGAEEERIRLERLLSRRRQLLGETPPEKEETKLELESETGVAAQLRSMTEGKAAPDEETLPNPNPDPKPNPNPDPTPNPDHNDRRCSNKRRKIRRRRRRDSRASIPRKCLLVSPLASVKAGKAHTYPPVPPWRALLTPTLSLINSLSTDYINSLSTDYINSEY